MKFVRRPKVQHKQKGNGPTTEGSRTLDPRSNTDTHAGKHHHTDKGGAQLLCCTMHAVFHPMLTSLRFEGASVGQRAVRYFQAKKKKLPGQTHTSDVCPVIGNPLRCAQARRETRRGGDGAEGRGSLEALVDSWVYPRPLSLSPERAAQLTAPPSLGRGSHAGSRISFN